MKSIEKLNHLETHVEDDIHSIILDEEQTKKKYVIFISDMALLNTPLKGKIKSMLCKGIEKPRDFNDEHFIKKSFPEAMDEYESKILCFNLRDSSHLRYVQYNYAQLKNLCHIVIVYRDDFSLEHEEWIKTLRNLSYTLLIKFKHLLQAELRHEDGYLFYPLQLARPSSMLKKLLGKIPIIGCLFRKKATPSVEINN